MTSRRARVFLTCTLIFTISGVAYIVFTDNLLKRKWVASDIAALGKQMRRDPSDRGVRQDMYDYATSDYTFVAVYAISEIGRSGTAARDFVPFLVDRLHSEDPFAARAAARALFRLGPVAAPAVDELAEVVEHGHEGDDVTWFSAEALGNIGRPALKTLPILRARLGSGSWSFEHSLNESISKLEQLRESEEE